MGEKSPPVISTDDLLIIIVATLMGTLARYMTLRLDYRQYPSHPNGRMIHLVVGFIAAAIGAVAIPAIKSNNFTAVTFLALAIQNFRDVRKSERESLKDLETTEFTPRGNAYIDGIAKTFESRNYFALIVSLVTATTMESAKYLGLFPKTILGVVLGYAAFYFISHYSKGKTVGDISSIREAKIEVRNTELYVENIFISNLLGTENAQKLISEEGIAVIIEPTDNDLRIALENYGQRQAILFEATRTFGIKRYHFTRRDFSTGKVVICFVPIINDVDRLLAVVKNTPLLESVKKSPAVMN